MVDATRRKRKLTSGQLVLSRYYAKSNTPAFTRAGSHHPKRGSVSVSILGVLTAAAVAYSRRGRSDHVWSLEEIELLAG